MALQRFLGGYARLARPPAPVPAALALAPGLRLRADTDQLEQVLISLLRNALESGGVAPIVLRACADGAMARIEVLDGGARLPPSDNLFVPFFTTKPGGSGIGLVLSRQIVDAQGGSLELRPRSDAPGSVATLWLPLAADGAV
ncbi:HAMP domain-containing histidine kinase [Xanthomonas campestris pv. passiflorae]|uniref:HAMP domain-containing histidine kinase n=1 Tax=Xanthomonas campestris TaxID=339 RepID=UPI0024226E9B|nr:HAMP domain-containing histidine kinase [Xanthomonas campestris pv. passiflorae]